jgi:hypothetical protein
MDGWSWGPESIAAAVGAVMLGITFYTMIKGWRGRRPQVTGHVRGLGPSRRDQYSVLDIPIVVRNPSRHTIQISHVQLEQPDVAEFERGLGGIRGMDLDVPVAPGKEVSSAYKVRVPVRWKGTVVLRFDIAVPIGGSLVEKRLRLQNG